MYLTPDDVFLLGPHHYPFTQMGSNGDGRAYYRNFTE
jgi:hypothetical protein